MKLFLAVAALTTSLTTALPSVITADPINAAAISCKLGPNEFCGDKDLHHVGHYAIYQTKSYSEATGCQCTVATKISDSTISWVTKFTWLSDNSEVKMYHNARNDLPTVSLRDIQSLYTTMSYTLKYDGTMTGTVAYTLSGSSSKGGLSIEVKVILAQLGDMQPVPDLNKVLINSVTIGGVKFTLFYVEDRNKVTYTFVANQMTMSFQGNLMEFYTTIFSLSAKEKNYWSAYSLDSSDHLDNVLFGIDVVDATNGLMTVPTYSTIRTLVNAK